MATFIAILLLLMPLVLIEIYSKREFELSCFDQFNKWKKPKILAVIIIFSYCLYILIFGHQYVAVGEYNHDIDFEDLFSYYIFPGTCLSAIIYAKPFGYLFSSGAGNCEEGSFLIGWLGLIYFILALTVDIMFVS